MSESILIVGNGASLKGSNLGSKIDNFDKVFRFNNWKCDGYESDVGTKITNWILYNPSKIEDGYAEKQIGLEEIWYISWNFQNLLEDWKSNHLLKRLSVYDKIKRHQSVQSSRFLQKNHQKPSTGLMLIQILLHMYNKVYIVGFDFILGEFSHYYGQKKMQDVLKTHAHDKETELKILSNLINENKLILLQSDTYIEKSTSINTSINSNICKSCGKTSELYFWESRICHHCEYPL